MAGEPIGDADRGRRRARRLRPARRAVSSRTSACSCVSDLHLEKGSSLRAARHADAALRHRRDAAAAAGGDRPTTEPKIVVSLGDSFHDGEGAARLPESFRDEPRRADGRPRLVLGRRQPRPGRAGRPAGRDRAGACRRRAAVPPRAVARRAGRARSPAICIPAPASCSAAARCAAAASPPTASASIMPAFGAYTGSLNVLDRAYAGLFRRDGADGLHDRRRPHLRHCRRDAAAGLT